MKKFFIISLTILACIFSQMTLSCYALDFSPTQIELEYSDAPEDTAYIDILAKINTDDEAYTDFNAVPERLVSDKGVNGSTHYVYEKLDIDENSEIAQYQEDGYVSLSIHSKDVEKLVILKDYGNDSDHLEIKCDADEFYEKYKNFRIAYVGEYGEVLKVTHKTHKRYSGKKPYAFVADNKKAVYRSFGDPPLIVLIITFFIIVIPLVLIFFIIRKTITRIKIRKKMRNYIKRVDDKKSTDNQK